MSGADPSRPGWAGDRRWFAIVGAQRSRSTYVHRAIAPHPQVFTPPREIAYFEDPTYSRSGAEQFLEHFARARPEDVVGFKRPELLGRPEAPARLAEAMPDARLVAVLREPISRTISAYFHYMRSNYLPLRPLNEGLGALLSNGSTARYAHAHEVLDFSHYAEGLARLHDWFDAEQILVLLDADLEDDLDASMRRIHLHLGVDTNVATEHGRRPANEGVYEVGARMRMLRLASRLVYRREPDSGMIWHQDTKARRLMHRTIYEASRPFAPRSAPSATELDADLRRALGERFDPDVRRLEAMIGRSIPSWPAREPHDPSATP